MSIVYHFFCQFCDAPHFYLCLLCCPLPSDKGGAAKAPIAPSRRRIEGRRSFISLSTWSRWSDWNLEMMKCWSNKCVGLLGGWVGGWFETFKVLLVTIVLLAKSSDLVKVFGWLEVDRWEALGCDCLVLCPASPHHASNHPPHHASPNLPTLLWPHNHHPTHSKPPCQPCQAGMDFPEQNSKTSKF